MELIDDEDFDPANPPPIEYESSHCLGSGRPFTLVKMLARRYWKEAGIGRLPVPTDLIAHGGDNLTVEVRRVPLKAYHGAVWRLSDCWLLHLNSNDTPARQRFTLYHEIFHVLAHCKATPVFKKTAYGREGPFNELLADHFAATILLPRKWVREKWAEAKDINQMAAIFDVPSPVVWCMLKRLRLI
jgi:hypothetical protein